MGRDKVKHLINYSINLNRSHLGKFLTISELLNTTLLDKLEQNYYGQKAKYSRSKDETKQTLVLVNTPLCTLAAFSSSFKDINFSFWSQQKQTMKKNTNMLQIKDFED